jgi:hypothetical protein
MNSRTVSTGGDRKIGPVYLVRNGEMLIDSPVKATWPHVVNYPSWQNFPIVRHISGEPGQEGEVVLLKKDEEGFEFPPYYARTIKLEPERRIVWKTFPEHVGEVDFFGIVDFSVFDAQGRTRFCYNTIYEFLVPYQVDSELDAFRKQQNDNFDPLFSTVLPKLKALAEKRGA